MSSNITILDDTKHVIIADKPPFDIVQVLPSGTLEILLTKFSKLLFLFGVGGK